MATLQGLNNYENRFINEANSIFGNGIIEDLKSSPNWWAGRIKRGAFPLHMGLEQRQLIFRGGLGVQGGLSKWREVGLSRKGTATDPIGFDNCAPGEPDTYEFAYEQTHYRPYARDWQSLPLCVRDLKFQIEARQQLAYNIKTGIEFGISIVESFSRDVYLRFCWMAGRSFVLADGAQAFEYDDHYRFEYEPFKEIVDKSGERVPYIRFNSDLKVSTLNFEFLGIVHNYLKLNARSSAIANKSGVPIFGLIIDNQDFEKMIKDDPNLREDWRQAKPEVLIDGYGTFMLPTYRGFALYEDGGMPRFRFHNVDADGKVVATAVYPWIGGRQGTFGKVKQPNPAYYLAEFGLGVVFLNDVYDNLFIPTVASLGSGTSFGTVPGLNGEWTWLNIQDAEKNPFRETGYFYGRVEIAPRPLARVLDATCFLYRRCPIARATQCADLSDNATGTVNIQLPVAPADLDLEARQVRLTIAAVANLIVGQTVTIHKSTADTAGFTAYVASTAAAPTYTFAWAAGAIGAPTAAGDFTAGAAVEV